MTTKSHTAGAQKAQVSPPFATVRFTCINPKGSKHDTKPIWHTLVSLEHEIRNTSAATKAELPWIKLALIGHKRSPNGCIRHDANILESTGCEIDYDGDKHLTGTRIPFVTAVSRLKKAGIEALVYTTPSDTPTEPHWRAICPFSEERDPKDRARFVARLNGLFDGTLDPASFRISQSFYYGNVIGKPPVSVKIVEGQRIDLADSLDAGAVFASKKTPDEFDDYEPSEPGQWSIEKLREMVAAIDANIAYPDWIKIGFGIHYETGGSEEGFELFDTWSQGGANYNKKTTTEQIWKDAKKKSDHPATGWTILTYALAADPPWTGQAPQPTAEELGFGKYHDHYDPSYDDLIGYTAEEFRDFFRTGKVKPADFIGFDRSYDEYTEDELRNFFRTAKHKPADPDDDPIGDMGAAAAPVIIDATPYFWEDGTEIPETDWLMGTTYARKIVTGIIAPGGGKKTAKIVVDALSMATGRNLLGDKLDDERPRQGSLRVWYVNLEDPNVELRRRFTAACIHYGITKEMIGDRLFVDGRELSIIMAEESKNGFKICTPIVDGVKKAIGDNNIDVMIVDPFVSSHAVSENDNMRIDAVVKQWAKIADEMNCGVGIAHHIRKSKAGQLGFDADDARGASAFVNACRKVVTLNSMATTEADNYKIEEKDRYRYFRYGEGKENISPPSDRAVWRKIISQPLGNNLKFGGDNRQVVTAWTPPQVTDVASVDELKRALAVIEKGEWLKSSRAKKWVGNAIIETLGWSTDTKNKKAAKAIVEKWIEDGVLKIDMRKNEHREMREFVIVNKPTDEIFDEVEPSEDDEEGLI